jgi:alkylation response protein AidB-like acyl-CoA dehydrogenase
MDFSLTQEQQALQDSVRRFCDREYGFERRRQLLGRPEGFARANWATFAELGWLGAGLAEEAGGYGGGPVETMIILEQMGRALVLEPFLSCAVLAAHAIAAQSSPGQRENLLGSVVAGEKLVALAHDEAFATTAKRRGAGYVLSGRTNFVLGGPSADILLVCAQVKSPRPSEGSLSLLLVDPSAPGVTRHNYHAVDGRRVSDIIFADVELGPDALIGEEGAALPAIELAFDHGIIGLCAEAVGAMDAALWLTRDYLKTRRQFGHTLNTFQALQHRMADMLIETELARSMLYRGIASLAETDPAARRKGVSAAKVQIGEAGYFVGGQAIQLHGAIGLTEECNVGHYFKRLTLVRGLFGATDAHLARFAAAP